jgi:hypothetical protein
MMNTQSGNIEIALLKEDMPLLQADLETFNAIMRSFPELDRDECKQVERIYKEHLKEKYAKRIQSAIGNK